MALVPLKKDASGQWTYWDDVRGAEVNGQGEILRSQGGPQGQTAVPQPIPSSAMGQQSSSGGSPYMAGAGDQELAASASQGGPAMVSAGEQAAAQPGQYPSAPTAGTTAGTTAGAIGTIGSSAYKIANSGEQTSGGSTPSEGSQRGSNAMSGAAGGAAAGTMVAPGIGTVIGAAVGAVGGAVMPTEGKSKSERYNEQLLATKLDMTRMAYRNRGGDEVVGFIAEEKARGLRYRPFVVMLKARTALGRELTPEERTSISRGGYGTVSQTQANELAYTQKQQGQRATANTVLQGTAMAFLTAVGLRLGKRLLLGA